jgi:peptidyl-Lys metalloendopeptidase
MKTGGMGLAGLLVLVLSALPLMAQAGDISVEIYSDTNQLAADEQVILAVSLTNHGRSAARVLKWYTAVDGIDEDLFKVSRDGQTLAYLGAHFKRPAPEDGDYLVLKPGQTVTHLAELSDVYDFAQTGEYSVQFKVESLTLFDPAAAHRQNMRDAKVERLESNSLSIWVQGRQTNWAIGDPAERKGSAKAPPAPPPPPAGNVSFSGGCTASQASTIVTAVNSARSISSNANGYLQANTSGRRYTTWFGSYDGTRYSTVKTHFTAISNAMTTALITVDCKCKQSYYAYVYANQPYKIYVCRAFWSAPMNGTDSKAGTLVHEMSHFDAVANTDDVVYGQTGAKNLAISNPNDAVRNADSHEYFAENTPSQN